MSKTPLIDIEDAVQDMSDEALECRDYGHTWKAFTASRQSYGFERVLRCPNCKTQRHQTLDRRGGVVQNHYTYEDGYLIKGLGRINGSRKDAVRLASLLRSIPEETSVKPKSTARKKKAA